jgi:uncharacterized protein (TIGR02996 family)
MSEEAAFLMALKANPADDTARLVYADWLDEHDQPHKAEYLRAVVEVARAPEDAAATARLLAAVPHADLDWRLEVGARFALILDGYTDKIRAIRWLREVTGEGLGEAKRASENLPYVVFEVEPWETANTELVTTRAGGLRTRLVSVQGPPYDTTKRYRLTVWTDVFGQQGASEAQLVEFRAEAREALERVLEAARCLSLEPRERNGYTWLAQALTRSQVRRALAHLSAHLPEFQPGRRWRIWLQANVST